MIENELIIYKKRTIVKYYWIIFREGIKGSGVNLSNLESPHCFVIRCFLQTVSCAMFECSGYFICIVNRQELKGLLKKDDLLKTALRLSWLSQRSACQPLLSWTGLQSSFSTKTLGMVGYLGVQFWSKMSIKRQQLRNPSPTLKHQHTEKLSVTRHHWPTTSTSSLTTIPYLRNVLDVYVWQSFVTHCSRQFSAVQNGGFCEQFSSKIFTECLPPIQAFSSVADWEKYC